MNWKKLEANPLTWKAIWFVLLAFFLFALSGAILSAEFPPSLLLAFTNLVALYGLAYEKPIWSLKFWKGYFWVAAAVILALVAALLATLLSSVSAESDLALIVVAVFVGSLFFSLLVFAIELRGLYLYAFKREAIWLPQNA